MKKIIYTISIILLIGLILISSYFIFLELIENKNKEDTFEELTEVVKENNSDDIEQEANLEKLYAINNDLVGWISISGTSINYPVMQSKANPNYYLNKDFYKKYSSWGVPYEFTTLNKKIQYEIFAVLKTVAYSDKGFKYYEYINLNSEDEFNKFTSKCSELSIFKTNINPKYGNKLITLSTCAYHAENGRLVIIASEVDK